MNDVKTDNTGIVDEQSRNSNFNSGLKANTSKTIPDNNTGNVNNTEIEAIRESNYRINIVDEQSDTIEKNIVNISLPPLIDTALTVSYVTSDLLDTDLLSNCSSGYHANTMSISSVDEMEECSPLGSAPVDPATSYANTSSHCNNVPERRERGRDENDAENDAENDVRAGDDDRPAAGTMNTVTGMDETPSGVELRHAASETTSVTLNVGSLSESAITELRRFSSLIRSRDGVDHSQRDDTGADACTVLDTFNDTETDTENDTEIDAVTNNTENDTEIDAATNNTENDTEIDAVTNNTESDKESTSVTDDNNERLNSTVADSADDVTTDVQPSCDVIDDGNILPLHQSTSGRGFLKYWNGGTWLRKVRSYEFPWLRNFKEAVQDVLIDMFIPDTDTGVDMEAIMDEMIKEYNSQLEKSGSSVGSEISIQLTPTCSNTVTNEQHTTHDSNTDILPENINTVDNNTIKGEKSNINITDTVYKSEILIDAKHNIDSIPINKLSNTSSTVNDANIDVLTENINIQNIDNHELSGNETSSNLSDNKHIIATPITTELVKANDTETYFTVTHSSITLHLTCDAIVPILDSGNTERDDTTKLDTDNPNLNKTTKSDTSGTKASDAILNVGIEVSNDKHESSHSVQTPLQNESSSSIERLAQDEERDDRRTSSSSSVQRTTDDSSTVGVSNADLHVDIGLDNRVLLCSTDDNSGHVIDIGYLSPHAFQAPVNTKDIEFNTNFNFTKRLRNDMLIKDGVDNSSIKEYIDKLMTTSIDLLKISDIEFQQNLKLNENLDENKINNNVINTLDIDFNKHFKAIEIADENMIVHDGANKSTLNKYIDTLMINSINVIKYENKIIIKKANLNTSENEIQNSTSKLHINIDDDCIRDKHMENIVSLKDYVNKVMENSINIIDNENKSNYKKNNSNSSEKSLQNSISKSVLNNKNVDINDVHNENKCTLKESVNKELNCDIHIEIKNKEKILPDSIEEKIRSINTIQIDNTIHLNKSIPKLIVGDNINTLDTIPQETLSECAIKDEKQERSDNIIDAIDVNRDEIDITDKSKPMIDTNDVSRDEIDITDKNKPIIDTNDISRGDIDITDKSKPMIDTNDVSRGDIDITDKSKPISDSTNETIDSRDNTDNNIGSKDTTDNNIASKDTTDKIKDKNEKTDPMCNSEVSYDESMEIRQMTKVMDNIDRKITRMKITIKAKPFGVKESVGTSEQNNDQDNN